MTLWGRFLKITLPFAAVVSAVGYGEARILATASVGMYRAWEPPEHRGR